MAGIMDLMDWKGRRVTVLRFMVFGERLFVFTVVLAVVMDPLPADHHLHHGMTSLSFWVLFMNSTERMYIPGCKARASSMTEAGSANLLEVIRFPVRPKRLIKTSPASGGMPEIRT